MKDQTEDVVWESPPVRTGGRTPGKFIPLAAMLMRKPGEWLRFPCAPGSLSYYASHIRNGEILGFAPPFSFETQRCLRHPEDGKTYLYVRYVGEVKAISSTTQLPQG